jgi:hypothetical protein
VEITTTLVASQVDGVSSVTAFVDFLPQLDCGQFTKISVVALAPRRVTSSPRPHNLVVARLSWRLLDFLVCMATREVLGVLVTVATLVVLVVLAVVIPLRVGSSYWGATNLGDEAGVTLGS